VPYAELPDLYRGALAFVFPSLWEGFGLPVLEAMACGTPVITSVGSGTEEVAGDAALLVDPVHSDSLSQLLLRLLDQPSLREQCRRQGLERATQFSWGATALATRDFLESLSGA
jgi:glycosyltransferase involved in cell wall biosynthesis